MRIEKIMLEAPTVEVAVASPGKIVVDGEGVFDSGLISTISDVLLNALPPHIRRMRCCFE